MAVEESDGRGGKRRSNPARKEKRGTPQGSPISPLLANLYMRRFILGWKQNGYEKLSMLTGRKTLGEETAEKVGQLNALLRGWGNYFCLGPVSKACRVVDAHARDRLRWWLRKKHKVQGSGTGRFPDEYLYETLGLHRLETTTRSFPWAKA